VKNISCQLTTQQVLARVKLVTRRLGWKNLKPGEILQICEKCMGMKKGEKIRRLALVLVKSVRRERLDKITKADCRLEGFPDLSPSEFVAMFCKHMHCRPGAIVTRIEWRYLTGAESDLVVVFQKAKRTTPAMIRQLEKAAASIKKKGGLS
jgi:hypothetical protein